MTMRYGFINGFKVSLAQPLAEGETSLVLTQGGDALSDATNDYRYRLTLYTVEVINAEYVETQREIVDVVGVNGNTLTIEGGLEGTTRPAGGWPTATLIELRYTAELIATGAAAWSAFSTKGLVSVNGDGTASTLSIGNGIKTLPALSAAETLAWATVAGSESRRATLSPDEKYLVIQDHTYDNDNVPSARVYDTDTQFEVAVIPGVPAANSDSGYAAIFSPDGSRMFMVYTYYTTDVNPADTNIAQGAIRCYQTSDWSLEKEILASDPAIYDKLWTWWPRDFYFLEGTTKILISTEGFIWGNLGTKGTDDWTDNTVVTILDTSDWSLTVPSFPDLSRETGDSAEGLLASPRNIAVSENLNKVVLTQLWDVYPEVVMVLDYDTIAGTYRVNTNIESALDETGYIQTGAVFIRDDRYAWVVTINTCDVGTPLLRIIDLKDETVWYPTDGTQELNLGKVRDTAAIDEDNGTVTLVTTNHIAVYDLDTRALLRLDEVTDIEGLSPWKFGVFSHKDQCLYGSVGDGVQKLPYDPTALTLASPQPQKGKLNQPQPPVDPPAPIESVALMSDEIDLSDAAAVVPFSIPDGKTLFVDRFDVVITSAGNTGGSPAIQVGTDNTTPGNYLGNTAVTKTTVGGREVHDPLLQDGTATLEASIVTAGTGTDHKGCIVVHGFVKQD